VDEPKTATYIRPGSEEEQMNLPGTLAMLAVALVAVGVVLAVCAHAIQSIAVAFLLELLSTIHASPRDLAIVAYRTGVLLAMTGLVVGMIAYLLSIESSRNSRGRRN
jgi:hypothetical protein